MDQCPTSFKNAEVPATYFVKITIARQFTVEQEKWFACIPISEC